MELSQMTFEIFTKLEQNWLDNYSPTPSKKIRILSLDGGPSSSSVSSSLLLSLESHLQTLSHNPLARIPDFFDLVIASGPSALLASLLLASDPDHPTRPLFSALDAISLLRQHSSHLQKPRSKLSSLLPRKSPHSGKTLDRLLQSALRRPSDGKPLTLRDTCKPLLIPCFDLLTSAPFVFSRAGAADSPSLDFDLWKVCRAAMATPSLYKPFPLTSVDGKTACLGVDGGLVMNNPTAAAVTHVLHNKIDFPSVNGVEDLLVLSLGNGTSSAPSTRHNGNGECSTAAVVGIVLDGVSETVDQLMGNAFCWNRADYVRIQANGLEGTTEEEVLKERAVETLPFGGKRLLTETNGQRIQSFVQRIVAAGRSSLPASPLKAASPLVDGR